MKKVKVSPQGTGGMKINIPKQVKGVLKLNYGDYIEFIIKDDKVEIRKEGENDEL